MPSSPVPHKPKEQLIEPELQVLFEALKAHIKSEHESSSEIKKIMDQRSNSDADPNSTEWKIRNLQRVCDIIYDMVSCVCVRV